MAISGHKTRAVFDRYNIVAERDLHDAARRLEMHLSGSHQQALGTIPNKNDGPSSPAEPETA